jgi:hypothetical protein
VVIAAKAKRRNWVFYEGFFDWGVLLAETKARGATQKK